MSDGFPNRPRILRGAFVEYGLTLPPLVVVFQYNPVTLTRSRTLTTDLPRRPPWAPPEDYATRQRDLRTMHGEVIDLFDLQTKQVTTVQEQTISFEIRLDATDALDDENKIAQLLGVGPRLSTLERMAYPKDDNLLNLALGSLLSGKKGFKFVTGKNPPVILFVFGRKRVLPVNINSLTITETEFSTTLNPIRATVAVELTVIEGKNPAYLYTEAMTEAMSAINLANIGDTKNIVVP